MSLTASDYTPDFKGIAWNLPIEHWSPSSLDMLHRCPYQWQQRYIFKRKQRPAESLTTGTAVHAGAERNYRQKIDSHEDIAMIDLIEWFMDEGFSHVVERDEKQAQEEVPWDTSYDQARERGKTMLAAYHHVVAPRIQPLEVEQVIRVDFGLPVPVEGRFDVSREASVIDIKTGRSKAMKPKESWRIQAAVYGAAENKPVEFHSVSGAIKKDGSMGAINIVTPLEAEALLVHPSAVEREEMTRSIQALSALACFYMEHYGPDQPWPTTGRFHTWACDFCGFRSGCPAWKGVD